MIRNVLVAVGVLFAALAVNAPAAPVVPSVVAPEPSTFILVGGVGVAGFLLRHIRVQK